MQKEFEESVFGRRHMSFKSIRDQLQGATLIRMIEGRPYQPLPILAIKSNQHHSKDYYYMLFVFVLGSADQINLKLQRG